MNQFHNQGLQVRAKLADLFGKLSGRKFPLKQLLKRSFLLVFAISFSTVLLLDNLQAFAQFPQLPSSATIIQPEILQPRQLPRQEIRGVWVSTNDFNVMKTRSGLKDAVNQLRRLNFNTIYPVVWNSGYTKFPSYTAKRAGIPFFFKGTDGQDVLADLISQSHRQGLLVLPWFEFGFMTPETSELALNHPEWLTQKRDGTRTSNSAAGEVAWLNPFHPQVQQFIQNLVLEVVSRYDVDGIQFDDHMSLPRDFGYDKYTVALYTQETENPPPANSADEAWVKWRADKITDFMKAVFFAIKAVDKNCIVSVAPNPQRFSYEYFLADWERWERMGLIEDLIVQIYRNDMNVFVKELQQPEVIAAKKHIPTSIGIISGLKNKHVPVQQIQAQVKQVRDRNFAGVSFFFYETLWNMSKEPSQQRVSGFRGLFSEPAKYPNLLANSKS